MEHRSLLKWATDLLERRSFLKWGTNLMGGLFATVLGVPAAGYLLDPRNRAAAPGQFRRVGRLSELKENVPQSVVLRDIRLDAWTLHPNDVLGRVWLIWRGGDEVDAYTSLCPHLGGSINFDGKKFVCPLHGATYDFECHRVSDEVLGRANPAPRDMDSLEIQLVQDPAKDGDFFIEVKYENFVQGHAEKIKKS
jgi:menaquinol-cytochrome c reductase iron-sulfur subunit